MIAAGFGRLRAVTLMFALLVLAGGYAYWVVPKEAAPEITIPTFIVNVSLSGIYAEDSARLLVRPMERQLQGMAGLRRLSAQAGEGFAIITAEFTPGSDTQEALFEVRDKVELAQIDLPPAAEEPTITEIDTSLFPVLTLAISGPLTERALVGLARGLRDRIEGVPGVLEVDLAGDRTDMIEVMIDPLAIESYRISYEQVIQAVSRNNQLVAAGAFDTGAGRIAVSIPGTIQDVADVLNIPVLVRDGIVVTVQDVAVVRQTFEDRTTFARIDGDDTIALDVRKAGGANIITTVAAVLDVVDQASLDWPEGVQATTLMNQADDIEMLLGDLENNVISAILLVLLTIIIPLGIGASLLVAIAIPGSFLAGILAIYTLGFTLNIVVLFGLILVIGMLVDGALVVVERAERLMEEGQTRSAAFLAASQRMAWPIIASAATTLSVFIPLLFWPGVAGEFMRYLPATVIVTLTASLFMALLFVPVLGTMLGRHRPTQRAETLDPAGTRYGRTLLYLIARPGLTLGLAILMLIGAFMIYASFGRGVEFFPAVEPDVAQMRVSAQGNFSVRESDELVQLVEQSVTGIPGIRRIYARTIGDTRTRLTSNLPGDVIGTIQLEFEDWRTRRPASQIIEEVRQRTAELPGISVQVREQEMGPPTGTPIQVEIAGRDRALLLGAVEQVMELMEEIGGFIDITSDAPVPGVEVRLLIDREQAASYGVDIATLGTAVQLLTTGVVLGSYLPEYTDEQVDIRLRFPPDDRTFAQLQNLRINTPQGLVPIANFVTLVPAPATSLVIRVDGRNLYTVASDIVPQTTVDQQIARLQRALANVELPPGVEVSFGGQVEDQEESAAFLISAFVIAVFLMFMILLIQFNSLFQSFMVLTAIVFSVAGVLIGLVIRQENFSIVMSGIGIVALAGIVVNNNIVLIDRYNELRAEFAPDEAALRTGVDRLRPVLLTAITTIAGLMPMVMGLTIDYAGRDIYFGAPSGQYWIQLATAVVGGLATATLVTIFFTPAMIAWRDRRREARLARTVNRATTRTRGSDEPQQVEAAG
jgi:multidrug efflux pump